MFEKSSGRWSTTWCQAFIQFVQIGRLATRLGKNEHWVLDSLPTNRLSEIVVLSHRELRGKRRLFICKCEESSSLYCLVVYITGTDFFCYIHFPRPDLFGRGLETQLLTCIVNGGPQSDASILLSATYWSCRSRAHTPHGAYTDTLHHPMNLWSQPVDFPRRP